MTGHDPHFYRPPFGRTSATVAEVAKQVGVRQVFWSASSFDYWYGEPEKIVQMSVDGTGDLTILLMHERKGTLAALDEVLTKLEERGFSFVLPDR
jgi:peptidoglycan/xylan/chitin deacetylase (PgdA/CDA1 family)